MEYTGVDIDKESIAWCLENVKPQEKRYRKIVNFVEADILQQINFTKKCRLDGSRDKETIHSMSEINTKMSGG